MHKSKYFIAASVLAGAVASTAQADEPAEGCYKPKRGFATSICTDTENCTTQSGIYRLVLRNEEAPIGERKLVLSGTFQGWIDLEESDPTIGLTVLHHQLNDARTGGVITTGPDIGQVIGGSLESGLEVIETLRIDKGLGDLSGVQSGGTITLVGKLESGINTFSVVPQPGDEVCFSSD